MLETQKDLPVFPVVYKKESKEVRNDEHHKFWAWATVFCFAMVMYTGYKHK